MVITNFRTGKNAIGDLSIRWIYKSAVLTSGPEFNLN